MKVVHRLGQLGYLETVRGKGGGMRLARPTQICIGAVVRDMEEELGVLGCLQGKAGYCRIEGSCVLQRALREATQAFLAVLDGYTLADLVKPRHALVRLMGLSTAAAKATAAGSARTRGSAGN